jgi:hypothetical protein
LGSIDSPSRQRQHGLRIGSLPEQARPSLRLAHFLRVKGERVGHLIAPVRPGEVVVAEEELKEPFCLSVAPPGKEIILADEFLDAMIGAPSPACAEAASHSGRRLAAMSLT